MAKIRIAVITGPTATGKTALGVELCKRLDGEVVGADSMQIYKGMVIGTAAPTEEEMQGIPHHLIGVVDPKNSFSVADYVNLASEAIEDISGRGKLPVLVGGTGLYISSLLSGTDFTGFEGDPDLRLALEEEFRQDPQAVFEKLVKADPEAAQKLHINNSKRVIRALEVYYSTGKPISQWTRDNRKQPPYDSRIIALNFHSRPTLYDRINRRVDNMIEAGLQSEVNRLVAEGVPQNATAMQAIGYKELVGVGREELQGAIETIKMNSRRYAKRQLTWLRRDPAVNFLYVDELSGGQLLETAIKIIEG